MLNLMKRFFFSLKTIMCMAFLILLVCVARTPLSISQATANPTPLSTTDQYLIHDINHAQHNLDISIYTLLSTYSIPLILRKHEMATQALVAQHKKGVKVHILLNRFLPPTNRALMKSFDQYHLQLQQKEKNWCAQQGISCTWSSPSFGFSHAKYVIIDHHIGYILTGNLPWSDCNKRHCTLNYAYRTTNRKVIGYLSRLFKADVANSQHNTRLTPKPIPKPLIIAPVGAKRMSDFIRLTQHKLQVIQPFLSSKTTLSNNILSALKKILEHHVEVNILTSKSKRSFQLNDQLKQLQEQFANLTIKWTKPNLFVHDKMMIRDHTTLLMGSTNWSYASVHRNREVSIVIDDRKLIDPVIKKFNTLWASAQT